MMVTVVGFFFLMKKLWVFDLPTLFIKVALFFSIFLFGERCALIRGGFYVGSLRLLGFLGLSLVL